MTKILKLPQVCQMTGLSRSSIYAYISQGKFPYPIRLGVKSVGWFENEIEDFLKERAQLRGGSKK